MNKRIASLAIVFAMLWSMLVSVLPVHVHAAPPVFESTQLKITANTTTAKPGDTITFTITMGPVSDLGTMQMVTKIPDGLSYVDNSGKLADGLKETLGFDILDWTEENDRPYAGEFPGCMINGVASAADYYSDTDTVLATFDCTVDEGASGVLQLGLYNLEFYSCQGEWPDHTDRFSVDNTRSLSLNRIIIFFFNFAAAVNGLSQGIDNSAHKTAAHRHAGSFSRAGYFCALTDLCVTSEQDTSDLIFPDILNHSLQACFKSHDLSVHRVINPIYGSDSVSYGDDSAYFTVLAHIVKIFYFFFQYGDYLI